MFSITTITLLAIAFVVSILLLALLIFFSRGKLFSCKSMKSRKEKAKEELDAEAFLMNNKSISSKRYSYLDIQKMTENFSNKLGQGGYGSVYKGQLEDGTHVAVKMLIESKKMGENFMNEVAAMSRTSHVNVVSLLGFCCEVLKKALVYEFMSNGSLDKFVVGEDVFVYHKLGYKSMHKIALGIARGLEYLHQGCDIRIVHFDIKPHNILLDKDLCPKISDFGLARLCPKKQRTMYKFGTIGYLAPEILLKSFGWVSHKSDVYSYGRMLSEIVLGKKKAVIEDSNDVCFPNSLYDKLYQGEELGLLESENEEEEVYARKMLIVSLWCMQCDPKRRPPMIKVVEMLEGSLDVLQMIPPKPALSSPSRISESLTSAAWTMSFACGEKIRFVAN